MRAVQCKQHRSDKTLPAKELAAEVEQATRFHQEVNAIDEYHVLTTAKRSSHTQRKLTEINREHAARGLFGVRLWTWDEIERFIDRSLPAKLALGLETSAELADLDAVGREYLQAIVDRVGDRRVLRNIRATGVKLSKVWTPLRVSVGPEDDLSSEEIADRLRVGDLNLVTGPVGSGKSEVLARLGARLAERALTAPSEPRPLLVRARDLTEFTDTALARSSENAAAGTIRHALLMLRSFATTWSVIVDGIDEAPHGPEIVDRLRRRFPGATIVASCRPSAASALEAAQTFRLESWGRSDGERFLAAMAEQHPERASLLRSFGPEASALLTQPLTASLAVLVALYEDVVPANLTLLFRAAIPLLVGSWATHRNKRDGWTPVAKDIRRFAVACVRGQQATLTRKAVAALARKVASDRAPLLREAAEIDLGVLVPVEGGYEFLFRGLAEYLAAEALRDKEGDVLAAAEQPWGAETASHALVLLADEGNTKRFRSLMRGLLKITRRHLSVSPRSLRRLTVAVRVAAIVGKPAERFAHLLAKRSIRVLSDEASPWRGDRLAEDVALLLRRAGPGSAELQQWMSATLADARQPAEYFRDRTETDGMFWLQALFHCDPSVRCEAVQRLRPFVGDESVTHALLFMLRDDPGSSVFEVPAAIEAGVGLRAAPRDGPIASYMELLRAMSTRDGQTPAAAAAAALRSDEQDVRVLARALAHARQWVPLQVLQELGGTPEGAAALDAAWPGWKGHSLPSNPTRPPDGREPPPPSRQTRRRLVVALRDTIARAGQPGSPLSLALGPDAQRLWLEAACEVGLFNPTGVVEGLLAGHATFFPPLSPAAQDSLGRAAIRHPELRYRLLARWPDFTPPRETNEQRYPGRSLEPLVIAGDAEAIRVYIEWLPKSPYLAGLLYNGPPPDSRVFDNPTVAEVGIQIVRRAWSGVIDGYVDRNGQRMKTASLAGVCVLKQFAPIWRDDPAITIDLFERLTSKDFNDRNAAFTGLSIAAIRETTRARIVPILRSSLTSGSHLERLVTLRSAIDLAVAQRLVDALRPEMLAVVESREPEAVAAAAALMPVTSSSDATRLSTLASKCEFFMTSFERLDLARLRELIALDPDSWATALTKFARERFGASLGVIAPVFDALPVPHKRKTARRLRGLLRGQALPWYVDAFDDKAYRPSDLVERFLFDADDE